MIFRRGTFVAVSLACALVLPLARGQDTGGAIEGIVADRSEGRVPSAHVVVRNLDTGLIRESVTNGTGLFRVTLLPVGKYSVTVSAPRFAPATIEPIVVDVSDTERVAVHLGIASAQSAITVSGEPSVVDSSTNTLARSSPAASLWICL